MPWLRPLALSLALIAAPVTSHAGDLTTRDVVELYRSGLGEDVLLALIDVDGGPFELTHADLLDLKAEGLPDRVVATLLRVGRPSGRKGAGAHGDEDHFDQYAPGASGSYGSGYSDINPTYGGSYIHDTRVVAVPVPVYVQDPRSHRRRRGDREHDAAPKVHVPGVQHGVAPGWHPASGTSRGSSATVDSIRHAPPGFHPGPVGPRPSSRREDQADSRRSRDSEPAPRKTPGVARSPSGSEGTSTPGVARSQRRPDN